VFVDSDDDDYGDGDDDIYGGDSSIWALIFLGHQIFNISFKSDIILNASC